VPLNALSTHLDQLLRDATELDTIHTQLGTGLPGRQYGLASLNRAAIVITVSAWESYVEELMRESLTALRPAAPPLGNWPALSAFILGELGRFNTPNAQNVANLIHRCLGLANVRSSRGWRNCTPAQTQGHLDAALALRHEIAHGVNPRPVIHNAYSNWLPGFVRRLARCTDDAVRNHLTTTLGLANPWPP
jgi:RiboL-PSP-HEPN